MANFIYNPSEYTATKFIPIPEGDHRVRITDVTSEIFSNGQPGYEITLEVNGYNNKLWHYITIDHMDTKKTNQRLGSFFNSFGIIDYDLDNYEGWIGHCGAVRVKHDVYEGKVIARVAFCLSADQHDKLPKWQDKPSNNVFDFDAPTNPPRNTPFASSVPTSNSTPFTPRVFGGLSL